MRDLRGFRAAVREHRRAVGRTQQQLARSIGLHPNVLSHKLNGRDNAVLTVPDVIGIVMALAGWGALVSRADVSALLDLMDVPWQAVPAAAWSAPPLAALRCDQDSAAAAGPGQFSAAAAGPGQFSAAAAGPGQFSTAAGHLTAPRPVTQRHRLTPAQLPCPATRFIGREQERAKVAAVVAAARLVTLTGVGGAGKTRLALQVARDVTADFADGVAFIDLAPVRDPALLTTAVARALGLAPMSAEAAEAHLAEALREREILLMVDNVEHLVDEAPLLTRLLAAAPAVRVLATSRIPLRLYGEHTVRVPPMHLPGDSGTGDSATGDSATGDSEAGDSTAGDSEAVQLFLARAQAADPDLALDDLAAVGQICTALDGLPLAIELAAAKVRLYSPEALLPQLRSRLALLTGGPRDLPRRQQTLRAALDWSYTLLPSGERRLFGRIGVFVGPFDAAAAASVSEGQDPVCALEGLTELADQSLIEVTAGETPAFRMLQTVREYALARLAETGEEDVVRRRHLAHFSALAIAAREGLAGPEQVGLLDRLEAAYPNMRAALEFACRQAGRDTRCLDAGLRLAAALGLLWQRRGSLAEGLLHLGRLLAVDDELCRPSLPQVRASAVLAACALACFEGDYPKAVELARHGIELCTPLGDHLGLAQAHRFLGEAALAVGDHRVAEPHFRRQLNEAVQAGYLPGQADAYNMRAQIARYRGEFRQAQSLLWQALKLFRQADNPGNVAVMLSSLGEVVRDEGRAAATRRLFTAALRRQTALRNKRHMAYALEGLAAAAALEDAGQQALVYLGAAQGLRDEIGAPLPPAERAILDRILAPAVAGLSAGKRQDTLTRGRNQPLLAVIEKALIPIH